MSLATYTVHHPEAIEGIVNFVEEEAFQLDVLNSFENRGWALYEFGSGGPLSSYLDLQCVVEMGRERNRLKYGAKYLVLPLSERDTDWPIIRDLMFMILSQGRGPYFVDLEAQKDEGEDDVWVEPVGVYLVDSVIMEPPILRLIIDPNLSRIKDPTRIRDHNACEIPLHLTCVHILQDQLMKALRVI